jgi:cyclopropane fatty-acyl-phospholipid synthase-like methyltransferase
MNRFAWAVDTMNLQPNDNILEIGCGVGLAIPEVLQYLPAGHLIAIDQSASMIMHAQKRCEAMMKNGRVDIREITLRKANFDAATFDRVMAFNVNLFWTGHAVAELKLIQSWLKPGGKVFLLFSPPSPTGAGRIITAAERNLRAGGFVVSTIAPVDKPCLVGVAGQKPT